MTVSSPAESAVTEPILAECKERGGSDACLIVTDEQRRNRPKAARPFGVALGNPLDVVAMLARGPTGPRCASLLASGLPKTITALSAGEDTV